MRSLVAVAVVALGLAWVVPSAEAAAGKDLVADAFHLPPGVTLRADQRDDFNRLKQRYEPPLRSAVNKLEDAKDDKEKLPLAREVLKMKAEIKEGIDRILAKPDPNRPKPQAKKPSNKKKPAHKKKKRRR